MRRIKNYILSLLLFSFFISNFVYGSLTWPTGGSSVTKGKFTILQVMHYKDPDTYPNLDTAPNDKGKLYDVIEFQNHMQEQGWTLAMEHKDTQVTLNDFITCSAGALYFAGHGTYEGGIVLSPGGVDTKYYSNDLVAWGGVKWVFFSSCDTLNDIGNWFNTFTKSSGTVHTMCGFWGEVYTGDLNKMMPYVMEYLFGNKNAGISQLSVWESWKLGAQIYDMPWQIYFVKSAQNEKITNPLTISQYDVWEANCYTGPNWDGTPVPIDPSITSTTRGAVDDNPTDVTSQKITKTLNKGRISLDYHKPRKLKMYAITSISPEIKDYNAYERNFYAKFGGKLNLYSLRKVETETKVGYSNNVEDVQYYKPTGAIFYHRGLSQQYLEDFIANNKKANNGGVKKIARDFIDEYGGGLPDDGVLDGIHPVVLKNMRTGERKVQSYLLHFEKRINGIKVAGSGADGITVEVDADGIAYYQRLWRNYEINKNVTLSEEQIIDEDKALEQNYAGVSARYGGTKEKPLKINEVNLVYKASRFDDNSNIAIPAWEYKNESGVAIYLNAATGEILD